MKSSTSSIYRKDAMLSIRKDLSSKSQLPVHIASASFTFLEQYAAIASETIRNLTIASLTWYVKHFYHEPLARETWATTPRVLDVK